MVFVPFSAVQCLCFLETFISIPPNESIHEFCWGSGVGYRFEYSQEDSLGHWAALSRPLLFIVSLVDMQPCLLGIGRKPCIWEVAIELWRTWVEMGRQLCLGCEQKGMRHVTYEKMGLGREPGATSTIPYLSLGDLQRLGNITPVFLTISGPRSFKLTNVSDYHFAVVFSSQYPNSWVPEECFSWY